MSSSKTNSNQFSPEEAIALEGNVAAVIKHCRARVEDLLSASSIASRTTLNDAFRGKRFSADTRRALTNGINALLAANDYSGPPVTETNLTTPGFFDELQKHITPDAIINDIVEHDKSVSRILVTNTKEWNFAVTTIAAAFEASLLDAQARQDRTAEKTILAVNSEIHERSGNYATAFHYLKQLIEVEDALLDWTGKVRALARAAWAAYHLDKLDEAELLCDDGTILVEQVLSNPDLRIVLKLMDCRAMLLARRRRFDEALNLLNISVQKCANLKSQPLIATTIHRIGIVFELRGNLGMAAQKFKEAMRIRDSIHAYAESCETRFRLLRVYERRGRIQDALQIALTCPNVPGSEHYKELKKFAHDRPQNEALTD